MKMKNYLSRGLHVLVPPRYIHQCRSIIESKQWQIQHFLEVGAPILLQKLHENDNNLDWHVPAPLESFNEVNFESQGV